tara:strand:- start:1127 stop:1447 length:321 start_codon:yes stop_codon:yes gene_type:complete
MEENNYGATGALFVAKQKRSDRSPDYNGILELDMEVVDDLVAQKQEGIEQPKVNLVGWKKVAKSGNAYLRIIANMEKERKDNQKEKVEQKPTEDKSDDEIDDPIPF